MTDQSQSGPPDRADDGPGTAGDAPAALGPDEVPAVLGPDEVPAVLSPDDAPTVVRPAAVAPLKPGASPAVPPPAVPPPAVPPPAVPPVPDWRPEDDLSSGGPAALAAERPELAVGAAFAGGLVLALILKRLAR